jgi:uncharacterized OB-fold protein
MGLGPQPRITEISRPFWDGCRAGRLLLQQCTRAECGRFVFYPRVCCPYCRCGDLAWQEASGDGTLRSWTVVHRPGHAAFLGDVPYVFAAVALAEGPVIHTRLLVPPDAPSLAIGATLRVTFRDEVAGVVLPAFVPVGEADSVAAEAGKRVKTAPQD